MSRTIKYRIKFFTDWHCGSGLSSGADLDLLVVKDSQKLPFIPGKTIKGLLREAIKEISELDSTIIFDKVFGVEAKPKDRETVQGCCFFTNVCLEDDQRNTISENNLQKFLYRKTASTAINKQGVAKEHSLREMEVTIPCELVGEILNVPDEFVLVMEKGLKYIKRIGQNRNRGLGRCTILIEGGEQ